MAAAGGFISTSDLGLMFKAACGDP